MTDEIISGAQLAALGGASDIVVVDCRFVLGQPGAGRDAFLEGHIPGAVYAHLEADLSGPASTDRGRHPLPPPAHLRALFGRLGIGAGIRVVAYDDAYGMVAARLWWMLRYMGHDDVSVLDGGWQAWVASGCEVAAGSAENDARVFTGEADVRRLVRIEDVPACASLIDAREPARYRGEIEPIDPTPGHIPGATNHFWRENLATDGCLLPPAELRARFEQTTGRIPDAGTTHYCGSGVSACHNILAQVAAGLPEPRLYCGSWSEWCRDASRRVIMGGEPGR